MSAVGFPLHVRTLGCKVNRVAGERLVAELMALGAVLTSEDEARLVVVNACAVTGEADAKVRKAVRRALGGASRPTVIVAGCVTAEGAESLGSFDDRVLVTSTYEAALSKVAELVGGVASRTPSLRVGEAFRTRANVLVQQGCDSFCAYCIVPLVRGAARSEPLLEIVAEVRALVEAGVAEVVLTGTNIGRYDGDVGLPGLLEAVADTGIGRIRLSSIEPGDVDERFLSTASSIPAFMPHLHIPLQSGSDEVLQAMGRHYDAAFFRRAVSFAREAIPGLAVTTDVLAGFPGETEPQAAETLEFCEEIGFQRLHVFRFSPRPGTAAEKVAGRIDPREAANRARSLRRLSARLLSAYRSGRIGGRAEALVEDIEPASATSRGSGTVAQEGAVGGEPVGRAPREAVGTTEDYMKVRFSLHEGSVGDVVPVRLDTMAEGGMRATGVPLDASACR